MPRFARILAVALVVLVPSGVRAQGSAPAEPVLERRPTSGPRPSAAIPEPDPWASAYVGLGGRTARLNLAQVDRALEPYRATYSRLDPADRGRIRQAFDDLIPGQRFTRYAISEPQARGMVYLALGPVDCNGPRRRGGRSSCAQAIDSLSRGAAWIHAAILSMSRTGQRRPHVEELTVVRAMNQGAGEMVLRASSCGCPAARPDAEALLAGTREAVAAVERSTMPAWMSLGDDRVARIARHSDALNRIFSRCTNEG
jgi:hypothetical protein